MTSFVPSITRLVQGIMCLVFNLIGSGYFPITFMYGPEFLTYKTLGHRILYMIAAVKIHLYKYYTVWCFLDASVIACGISYAGKNKDGEHQWDKLQCIKIWDVEGALSPIPAMKGWNHQTHIWLNRYCQDRMVKVGERPDLSVTIKTFLVSSFWHGYYPFYYFHLVFSGIYVVLAKEVFRSRAVFAFIPPVVQTILLKCQHELLLCFIGAHFFSLTFDKGYYISHSMYYYGWFVLPGALAIMKLGGFAKMAKKIE